MNALIRLKVALSQIMFPLVRDRIDLVVLGYPKTGNTWFSTMLRHLLLEHFSLPDECFDKVIPYKIAELFGRKNMVTPTIFSTHNLPYFHFESASEMNVINEHFNGRKVLVLIRDPKDTLVSLYMHGRYREQWLHDEDMNSFVKHPKYGIDKFIAYYQQIERGRKHFETLIPVSYESLHVQAEKILMNVAEILALTEISQTAIGNAIRRSSFQNMRKIELNNKNKNFYTLRNPTDASNSKTYKVRAGKVGGYVNHLSTESIELIDTAIQEGLPKIFLESLNTDLLAASA